MPSATGTIDGQADSITAMFNIDGATYTYVGTPSSSIEPFSCASVTISYNAIEDLNGTPQFTCLIKHEDGIDYALFYVDNGPQILGGLDNPASSSTDIEGTGAWSKA